ncbi:MAG: M15 family metallopeptidase [Syntrophales bacterium]|nr:M15 family metallopeptidase [Syntrophales bacterium]MDD5533844.1 M15 family metallopeptidase [Syntrophales bacterium]
MRRYGMILVIVAVLFVCPVYGASQEKIPPGFVDVQKIIPSACFDIRYYGNYNFIGEKIDGYDAPKCYLTQEAAAALAEVQEELKPFALSLKIFDCYRPQRAVDHFVRWAADLKDVRRKTEFYPAVDKKNLFRDGFIAERSGHSRGSTLDLTIVPLPCPRKEADDSWTKHEECSPDPEKRSPDGGLDMGTGFDCFGRPSHTLNTGLSDQQRANRALIRRLMEKHGFRNLEEEWWHYTLVKEPYPDTYFNFPVR